MGYEYPLIYILPMSALKYGVHLLKIRILYPSTYPTQKKDRGISV
jgi:hypothetical protein